MEPSLENQDALSDSHLYAIPRVNGRQTTEQTPADDAEWFSMGVEEFVA